MSSLVTVPDARETVATSPDNRELLKWQRKLLPMMTRSIIGLAAVFFCFSAIHVYQVNQFIQTEHGRDIRSQIETQIAAPAGHVATGEEVLQNSLLLLEADTLDKRYHQASAQLLSRIWSRQLAFITGMVMAFLGAVFILGKMTESTSNITGEGAQWKVGISSASPGIILSAFGTILLITSLVIRTSMDLNDGPAYVTVLRRAAVTSTSGGNSAQTGDASKPVDLSELEKLTHDKKAPEENKK